MVVLKMTLQVRLQMRLQMILSGWCSAVAIRFVEEAATWMLGEG